MEPTSWLRDHEAVRAVLRQFHRAKSSWDDYLRTVAAASADGQSTMLIIDETHGLYGAESQSQPVWSTLKALLASASGALSPFCVVLLMPYGPDSALSNAATPVELASALRAFGWTAQSNCPGCV